MHHSAKPSIHPSIQPELFELQACSLWCGQVPHSWALGSNRQGGNSSRLGTAANGTNSVTNWHLLVWLWAAITQVQNIATHYPIFSFCFLSPLPGVGISPRSWRPPRGKIHTGCISTAPENTAVTTGIATQPQAGAGAMAINNQLGFWFLSSNIKILLFCLQVHLSTEILGILYLQLWEQFQRTWKAESAKQGHVWEEQKVSVGTKSRTPNTIEDKSEIWTL